MDDQPLVVPMQLDALVVNASVQGRDSFRWWPFNYNSLAFFRSPEPVAMDRQTGTASPGIYLHWTLPEALRHGVQNQRTGDTDYPLVPNRWLIVRLGGTSQRQATAWVVESDCPAPAGPTGGPPRSSLYLLSQQVIDLWKNSSDPSRNSFRPEPATGELQTSLIGAKLPLASWSERAPSTMFLTAVAPSNPLFSIYTVHNAGVFSLYDDLAGVSNDTLSYFIFGWFSDSSNDILASWTMDQTSQTPYADLLGSLHWTIAGSSDTPSVSSVYHGAVFSIPWSMNGPAPINDPLQSIRESGMLNVAAGNTTIDAFTALIAKQIGDPAKAELLRAFQYDFLHILNQPNGEALLEEKIHQAWFSSKNGGYSWTIVENKSDGTTATNLTPKESAWLLTLNGKQAALNAAVAKLYSLQWDLHSLWFKRGYLGVPENRFPKPPAGVDPPGLGTFQSKLDTQLDPSQPGSVAAQVVAQFGVVRDLLGSLPQPLWTGTTNAETAFQNGIQSYAQQQGLDSTKKLKAVAAPRYWQAGNPVILFSGVTPAATAASDSNLMVRQTDELIASFTADGKVINAKNAESAIPQLPNVRALPSIAQSLFSEFFLLDPSNAAAIAAATGAKPTSVVAAMQAHDPGVYGNTLPAIPLTPWQQPWSPMILEWTASYDNLPFDGPGPAWWSFDGTDYRYTPGSRNPTLTSREIGGISLLSAHPSFVFGARLEEFVQKFGDDTALAQIDQWVQTMYQWKFLAQELTGFNEMLTLRDTRAYRRPGSNDLAGSLPVAALTGYGDGTIPQSLELSNAYLGQVNAAPFIPNGPALPFFGAREGQIYLTNVYLYDKFGRTLFAVQANTQSGLFSYQSFPIRIDGALVPDVKIPSDVRSVLQLPPRLLQYARLDFQLLDAADDDKVYGLDAGVMPISGWVLPNHLDHSLLLYAPDGAALGEYGLKAGLDGTRTGQWTPPPHRSLTLDGVSAMAPHLAEMIAAPELSLEAAFDALLSSIDSTLWTTDPLGNRADQNMSVLVGRPLALLRARLEFQLEGEPIGDTGFAATFQPPPPDFLKYRFSIRLGDQATRQDGLMGYFSGSNYGQFNSVAAPDSGAAQNYVKPIGPIGVAGGGNYLQVSFAPHDEAYVTLLADPRAAVHATTGILPVKQLDIPQQFVDAALATLEISFGLGPILTQMGPSPSQNGTTPPYPISIFYPLPVEQNGSWSWWESDATANSWKGYGLVRASADAQFTGAPNTLREGYLQFLATLVKPKS